MKTLGPLLIVALLACSAAAASAPAQLTTIYSFSGPDGAAPLGKLVFDQAGNLYGTTELGGANGGGSVFELSPNRDGTWAETTIYSFCQQADCLDGANPAAALTFDAAENLYGTTSVGGGPQCGQCGTVFELSPPLTLVGNGRSRCFTNFVRRGEIVARMARGHLASWFLMVRGTCMGPPPSAMPAGWCSSFRRE